MISDSVKLTNDEENSLSLLKAYIQKAQENKQEALVYVPLMLCKTLSLQNLAFETEGHWHYYPEKQAPNETAYQFDLSNHERLHLWNLLPMSVLENPSNSFLNQLSLVLKSALCKKNT